MIDNSSLPVGIHDMIEHVYRQLSIGLASSTVFASDGMGVQCQPANESSKALSA